MIVFFDASALIYLVEGAEPFASRVRSALAQLTKKHPKMGAAVSRLSWLECRVRPARNNELATLAKFDDVIGFEKLKVVHLNDSKFGLGSARDRHEHVGMGYIGREGFKAILHHEAIRELPMIVETDQDELGDHQGDLRMVRKLAK